MSESDIEALLTQSTRSGPLSNLESLDDLRISLAGAQEKTALMSHDGQWMRSHDSTPTTHILKLPMGLVEHRRADFSTSVENERMCMKLLAEFGLPVANTKTLQFGSQKVLGVERLHRKLHSSG